MEFPCSNNIAKYEVYLTRLATTLEMGVKHLKVMGDSNLLVYQTKGSFSLKEPSLAPYRMIAQKMEEKFSMFEIVVLGSQIIFERDSTRMEVSKRKESIVEMLKERF